MTPEELRQIADLVGGVTNLARITGKSRNWIHRRLSGAEQVDPLEAAGIKALADAHRKARKRRRPQNARRGPHYLPDGRISR